MENRRTVISTGIIAGFLFLPTLAFGYSAGTTHPALSDEAVDFFNHFYPELALSREEKGLVKQGSTEEDKPVSRVLNHFYDPVYNRGLVGGVSSKRWALNTNLQSQNDQVAGIGGLLLPKFSSAADYSWDRAVYDYVHGDKERALKNLGHILHLLQDLTTPPHVRNDEHPPAFDWGSPYEEWTSRFTPENFTVWGELVASGKRPIILASLGDYFDEVALFTNQNFFSKDSILTTQYSQPVANFERAETLSDNKSYVFGYKEPSIRIVRIKRETNSETGEVLTSYFLRDTDDLILNDYWGVLSKQAVVYGAGVIKLFFDKVEEEKQTLALFEENQSWFDKQVANVLEAFGGESADEQEANVAAAREEAPAEERETVAVNVEPVAPVPEADEPPVETQEPAEEQPSEEAIVEEKEVTEEEEEVPAETVDDNAEQEGDKQLADTDNEVGEIETEANTEEDSGQELEGAEEGDSAPAGNQSSGGGIAPDRHPPDKPVFTDPAASPVVVSTTTVALAGTAEVSAKITVAYEVGGATTTAETYAVGETWSLPGITLDVGTTTLEATATDDGGNVSEIARMTIVVEIDNDPPSAPELTILQCEHSLQTGDCLSGSETINLSWESVTDAVSYTIVKDGSVVDTVTATSSGVSVSDTTSSTIAVAAVDDAGNSATSTAQTVEVFESPVVINEIAWAGTQASSADEWVELYNRTDDTIVLDDVVLAADDGAPEITLSGTLAADSFYLIERTDDEATSVAADLTVAFSGSGGSGLSNSGEELRLLHALGSSATTTLDATPAVATCGGWCAGDSATNPLSMERTAPDTDGTKKESWASNDTFTKNGTDADGNNIQGTPKSRNSTNLFDIGYFCDPDTGSYEEGSFHEPLETASCTYLSSSFPNNAERYGDLYKGTVASSTIASGHFLNKNESKTEIDSFTGAGQGDSYFAAIFVIRTGPAFDDLTAFRDFFQTGNTAPPHLNYGILQFFYGSE